MQLIPVEVETSVVKISGFVSRPEFARRHNPLQYLIANGRNMRHPYFHKAVINCFTQLISPDTQPNYFLRFEVDPASIDVNIHPTKNEIKFENEQEIWRILNMTVKTALGKFAAVPSIDFESDPLPATASMGKELSMPREVDADPTFNPFAATNSGVTRNPGIAQPQYFGGQNHRPEPQRAGSSWAKLYSDFMEGVKDSDSRRSQDAGAGKMFETGETVAVTAPICIQHADRYIITSTAGGLMIIDQHRAHVKILYEEFLSIARSASGVTQQVMFPDVITLDPSQQLAFEGVEDELTRLGYKFHDMGDGKWSIEGVPSMLVKIDPRELIFRVLDSVSDDSVNYGNEGAPAETMMQRVALVMARSAAITRGKRLSIAEMEGIVSRLLAMPDLKFTPNGNPVVAVLDDPALLTMFA